MLAEVKITVPVTSCEFEEVGSTVPYTGDVEVETVTLHCVGQVEEVWDNGGDDMTGYRLSSPLHVERVEP